MPETSTPEVRPPSPFPDPQGLRGWASSYVSSLLASRKNPPFGDLEHFCFFIGYARSGHTLLGSLLDAHPEAVIAHELDIVNFVRHHFSRAQVFALIMERDRAFEELGWMWSGYSYEVPGQYQGRHTRIRVIGDKRGDHAALELAQRPEVLDRIRKVVRVPIRAVHVTRNPFDNIATASRKGGFRPVPGMTPVSRAIRWYEQSCVAVEAVRHLLDPDELFDIRYEAFLEDPEGSLASLCRFTGLEPDDEYLKACAGMIWSSASRTRDGVEWTGAERAQVDEIIARFPTLSSYSFDD